MFFSAEFVLAAILIVANYESKNFDMPSQTVPLTQTHWHRDLSTTRAQVCSCVETVGSYLQSLGIYNARLGSVDLSESNKVSLTIQRAFIKIEGNVVKEKMLEDVLRGGILPTIAIHEQTSHREVMDGLQRTHILAEAIRILITIEEGKVSSLPKFIQEMIKRIDTKILTVEQLLEQPVFILIYSNLSESEVVRLFMLLNVGQQKVSERHLLEILHRPLEQMFTIWGILSITEKTEKENGKQRLKWKAEEVKLPPYTLEYLVNAVRAYTTRDPQVKTKAQVQDVYDDQDKMTTIGPGLQQKLIEMGSDTTKSDFTWVFQQLNDQIIRIYKDNSKWRVAILQSDNFVLPLMAALGKARETARPEQIENNKAILLEELKKASPGEDPLLFSSDEEKSLDAMQSQIRSNIGRNRRAIVYKGWVEYLRKGAASNDCLIDWEEAAVI